jgi:hypothetical protein
VGRIAQAAALFAFVADQAGLFDTPPAKRIAKVKKENPNDIVFLHATSTAAWPELGHGGWPQIDPGKGLGNDFGRGFYTLNVSSADPRVIPTAVDWALRTASRQEALPVNSERKVRGPHES